MNKREAKRMACRDAAALLLDNLYGSGDPRYDQAVADLAGELERRGGVQMIVVLPGQRSLLDVLEEEHWRDDSAQLA